MDRITRLAARRMTQMICAIAACAGSISQLHGDQPVRQLRRQPRPVRTSDVADGYRERVLSRTDDSSSPVAAHIAQLPVDALDEGFDVSDEFESNLWWQTPLASPIGIAEQSIPVTIGELIDVSLMSSPRIAEVLTEPRIQRREWIMADAEFDPTAFLDGKFTDTNDPIGSELTTGNDAERFRDETLTSSAGLRKRSRYGGGIELAQRGGFQENNSTFLVPNPQATTRLELNFTQPLMRGRGKTINQTRIVLARLNTSAASDQARIEVQDHLLKIASAYWELYGARAEWLQRKRLLDRAAELVEMLRRREGIDTAKRQILRAEVALTRRRSNLLEIESRIRNAQAKLRALTGDARLTSLAQWELLPADRLVTHPLEFSLRDASITALDQRPDIAKSLQQIRALSVRVGAAQNQLLPKLDLILSGYAAGLEGRRRVFDSFTNQFSDGRPTYAAGLIYERPVGNRAARARFAREQLEMNRAFYRFQQTTEGALSEVEIAVRDIETAHVKAVTKLSSMAAARREVEYLNRRYRMLPDPNESAVLLIEDLLEAQERLANEEGDFVDAQTEYAVKRLRLRRAMGTLVQFSDSHCDRMQVIADLDSIPYTDPATHMLGETTAQPIMDAETDLQIVAPVQVEAYPRSLEHSTLGHGVLEHSTLGHGVLEHSTLGHGVLEHSTLGHGVLEHGTLGQQIDGMIESIEVRP